MALAKTLKPRHIELIALGGIIGSCFFLGTGYVLAEVGPAAILAYILAGIIVYAVTLCLAELTANSPNSGSFIYYTAKYVSPAIACGMGWSYWLNWIIYIPSECIAGGIIMHTFLPAVPTYMWATLFGLFITIINLTKVKIFGEIEFWLALVKIIALGLFSVIAILIFFDIIQNNTGGVLGGTYIVSDGGFFPKGKLILITTMVILLVNFQGSEIIGLAASESNNAEKQMPRIAKHVAIRIVGLYVIPVFLLATIFPWQKMSLSDSVFATALQYYHLDKFAAVFAFVVLVAAFSCANSGFYAAVRSLYGLSRARMAPSIFRKLNSLAIPHFAVYISIIAVWTFLILSFKLSASAAFTNLLAMSGFTATICWICICWSQYNFRKQLIRRNATDKILFKAPLFPYISLFGIWIQVLCLVLTLFNDELRGAFYFGAPAMIIPCCIYFFVSKKKNTKIVQRTISLKKVF
ncbi:amino acid permease [Francisella tularensis]|uniref:Amino acid permease n=3 Tax=Francisella tularensis TaxID=263 RepID=Q5NGG2_FRATT|nr:amino acid permease [Francisella tularensis]ADA78563.1 amino acid permease [Francisella tularensis subsp. tularensis NE061598]AFB78981.1 amino acid permease [Francisella tularensis subsp. tularensis TIGB03]AFB80526.1 amino acid permease [Francisella tularensis subsp. tularensis TI0902]AJI68554.1 amino acid permease family protein [Francisella tularensis subsp. tularensis SCHU S4]AJI71346.1 amino acid permease family protein [Francisella tularensis subsp. tularensis]